MSLDPVSVGAEALQAGLGVVQTIKGWSESKKLLPQLKAYQSPAEVAKILQATENYAQQGYDPTTLSYLTSQVNGATAASIGAAERMGADPNTLSANLQTQVNSLMRIGAENHAENMKNFGNYINALDMVVKEKGAEWQSQNDLIKNKLQAYNPNIGMQNIQNAFNAYMNTSASGKISDLFKVKADAVNDPTAGYVGSNVSNVGANSDGSPHFK